MHPCLLAQQVISDQGADASLLGKASGKSPEDAVNRLVSYKALARKIIDAGVAELPYPDIDEAANNEAQ